ncbi:MAG: phosphotransferase [Paramuribaculum sp.]|nr:phosphotransferase [Paramuribaculum sp.]
MQELSDLFTCLTGEKPESIIPIAGAGSERRYFFLTGSSLCCVGTAGVSEPENKAFIYMSREFAKMGLPVPEVLAVSEDNMTYLQSYAGSVSLFDFLEECRISGEYTPAHIAILENVMTKLAQFHTAGFSGFDFTKCYPTAEMNRRAIVWDLNYFKYSFLKTAGIEFDEDLLENDFERFVNMIESCGRDSIILRDCQSRNVMLKNGLHPVFIDFQGARKGCGLYDVVSFLWQARAAFPADLKKHLFNHYLASVPVLASSKSKLTSQLPLFILLRTLQVLGAYGFLGLVKKKEHFIKSIPAALDNLRELLNSGFPDLPHLRLVVEKMVSSKSFYKIEPQPGQLIVTVGSFSYKMGLPEDKSGNGGGFVFDCRALHNPGRYDEYKQLTGRDEPVIRFLEERGEVKDFLSAAWSMVDYSIERYMARGFTSLNVFFGCTGGRHRSVYCAERTASHIKERFGIEVHLIHRERKISETI